MRVFPCVLALSMLAFAFVPVAAAAATIACSQDAAFSGVDARCTVAGAPVYAGGGCGTLCAGTVIASCDETLSPGTPRVSCELPYVFCPYGPICPGPAL